MPRTIHSKPQPLLSKSSLLLNPFGEITFTGPKSTNFAFKAHIFYSPLLLSHRTHVQKPIICARKNKRGSGYQKLIKIVTFMASNLNTLPEPLGLVIEEFAAAVAAGGGNLGFWKGLGGGRFDGWGRKGKMNSGFLGFLVVSGLGLILFLFGGELKIDVVSGVLVLSLLGAVLVKGFKRGIKDWILGLCFFGVLLGLGLKKGEMRKWVERCRVRSPVLVLMKGKRRHGRRIW
ncbi:hypothetical protein Peur_027513 [Populus x canadensis]|uniref:uncharacterized protein LOC133670248 n=1 Tax=Populus nigra TaxID=3691 RepID=UPI002B2734BB|nr:uncharacterized protein LOC133670248 [Populus nigra]